MDSKRASVCVRARQVVDRRETDRHRAKVQKFAYGDARRDRERDRD